MLRLPGLTGTPGQISKVAKRFRVYFSEVDKHDEDDDYLGACATRRVAAPARGAALVTPLPPAPRRRALRSGPLDSDVSHVARGRVCRLLHAGEPRCRSDRTQLRTPSSHRTHGAIIECPSRATPPLALKILSAPEMGSRLISTIEKREREAGRPTAAEGSLIHKLQSALGWSARS